MQNKAAKRTLSDTPESKQSGQLIPGHPPNQDNTPVQSKKRPRAEKTPINSSVRKKYVRGKQGGLKGLMNMPLDIFTECLPIQIACLLSPGDLVSLARSGKCFRHMLLQRSAVQMWRRAGSNVPGLPPCPPHMCEPQYATLIFSKHCTLCGASATAKPDPHLCVRLCSSCRDTKLEELDSEYDSVVELVSFTTRIRPKRSKSQPRASKNSVFSLRHEVEEVYRKQKEFRNAGDEKGLSQWENDRRAVLLARAQTDHSREEELETMRKQRKERQERLKALGWTEEDMAFRGVEGKPWHALVYVPKPLTDRIWSNLLPKLIPMLGENRERNLEYGRKARRIERRTRVDQFLISMRYTAHPFESILAALGVGVPPPPDLAGLTPIRMTVAIYQSRVEIANPFPKTHTMLKWDGLKDLSEVEMPIEEVAAKLVERTPQISEKVMEWRNTVERRLAEKLESEAGGSQGEVVLKVKGSTESTAHLSKDARLLLRADCVFKRSELGKGRYLSYREQPPCYYPDFVSPYDHTLNERIHVSYQDADQEIKLDQYVRDVETEKIAKALLGQLGMPDVAWVELKTMKDRFQCGRCLDKRSRTWRSLVIHYITVLKTWDKEKDTKGEHSTRYSVVFRNVHDLEPNGHPKPLARLLSEEDAAEMTIPTGTILGDPLPGYPICFLCKATGRSEVQLSRDDMLEHMQDAHNVVEAAEEKMVVSVSYFKFPLVSQFGVANMLNTKGDHAKLMETRSKPTSDHSSPKPAAKERTYPIQQLSESSKKRVRRGKGSLKTLMQMPIEVFAEVSYTRFFECRSTKNFRKVLLQRSAIQLWRRAESNVPELPPCLPGMCEPQYAALLFSDHCTLFHSSLKYLLKRSFTAILSEEDLGDEESEDEESESEDRHQQILSLRRDVDNVLERLQRFRDSWDYPAILEWAEARRTTVSQRRRDAAPLARYLDSLNKAREEELSKLKQQRQEIVMERLKAIGWTDEDMDFHESGELLWSTVMDVAQPLTEQTWDDILPELNRLLEENRERHNAQARRLGRCHRVDQFLQEIESAQRPLRSIFEFLGVRQFSNWDDPFSSNNLSDTVMFGIPFPSTGIALKWDCLADLSEREITIDEVSVELDARRSWIESKILEWRADIERRLVRRFNDGARRLDDTGVTLTVGGSTELTAHLSGDQRLLLRADTIFTEPNVPSRVYIGGWHKPQDRSLPYYYPSLEFDLGEVYLSDSAPEDIEQDIYFSQYQRHTKMEEVVKPLLNDLGMPDVARIELKVMKPRFVCGRCVGKRPLSWDHMVDHFMAELEYWNEYKDRNTLHPIRHPIVYKNVHDLEAKNNPKRLVELITEQEAHSLLHQPYDPSLLYSFCLICHAKGRKYRQLNPDEMAMHQRDV
ncbi:hypothetical protein FRC07_000015 [Ceratobasidium sp. 392]|nr:hypothetical protein FRC07_000015 [Ceratobasidium sp. 392]